MSEIDPQEFGALKADMKRMKDDLKQIAEDVSEIKTTFSEAKGGWRTLAWLAGSAGAAGAAVHWAATNLVWK